MLFEKEAEGKEKIGKSINEAKRLLSREFSRDNRDKRRNKRGNFKRGRR